MDRPNSPPQIGRKTRSVVVFGLAHAVVYSFVAVGLWSAALSATEAGRPRTASILVWIALLTPLLTGGVAGYLAARRGNWGVGVGAATGIVFSVFMVAVAVWTIRDVNMAYSARVLTMLVAIPLTAIIGGAAGGQLYARKEHADEDCDWLDDFDDEYVEHVDGLVEYGGHITSETRHTELSRREQQQIYFSAKQIERRKKTGSENEGVFKVSEVYDFSNIERKWQQKWQEQNLFHTPQRGEGEPFYLLVMFPYPSGKLHMGHVRNYIIADVIARQKSMAGMNVLHPMGWDAFGLPAENAAIKRQIHPHEWTDRCITQMKEQFADLGITYDWSREINASEPDYYKWTQWLFLQMYHDGLAYQGEATVNWCPSCRTVLANEELEGDVCERCGTPVEARRAPGQWFFRITDYADQLLDDLKYLEDWPEQVRTMQENWIGRSEGFSFQLQIEDTDKTMEVFTTRIDTVYGVTFMVLAPEHPLTRELTEGTEYEEEVREFIGKAMRQDRAARTDAETEKNGIFTGRYAIHPLTGEKVPIWVANYVLMDYGTGAIMAVPAHDQRDFEFARKYDIPVRVVIQPEDERLDGDTMQQAYEGEGVMDNSHEFNGMPSTEAIESIADTMEDNGYGRRDVNYRLLDWLISRQRYWGAPIPIIYCDECGTVPVPEEDLPVMLPTDAEFKPTGESPLELNEEFVNTTCPKCGGPARRETDTMTTYVCSSWYYLRYINPDDDEKPFRTEDVDYWLPVDKYIGGVEHAVRHLLYARFVTKVLHDLEHLDFVEPFSELFTQGMICNRTPEGRLEKMSKSKGNAVAADEIIERYGADTARTFVLFVGPPDQDAEWSDDGVAGIHRFLGRLWRLTTDNIEAFDAEWRDHLDRELNEAQRAIRRKVHQTIRKVTDDVETMKFNTAVSAIMELANELGSFAEDMDPDTPEDCAVFSEALSMLIVLLSPFAPHMADELWERLGYSGSLLRHPWPEADSDIAAAENITIVVQVNGKVRDRLEVAAGTDMDEVVERAMDSEDVLRHTEGKDIQKVIKVPDRLINIVAS